MTHNSRNPLILTTPTRPTFRRYSLSDIGFMSPSEQTRNKYSPRQERQNPELSYRCHIDSRSPGFTTRVVQYNDEREKSSPICQSRYNRPGVFPIVHFFKKDLPIKSIQSTPQMNNSAELSKYNSPEQNRMLLESIIHSNSPSKIVTPHNEGSTKSVLDALKEISRKRIHSNEEEFTVKEGAKRACINNYAVGNNLRKKAKLTPLQTEGSVGSNTHIPRYDSMDELRASYTSMDERPVKKHKTKKAEESPKINHKSPSPVKSVNVETQTTLEVPAPKETVIPIITKVSNVETEKVETVQHPNKVKKVVPVKIFDETPLATMRKNRLVALMGTLTEDKVKETQNTRLEEKTDTKVETTNTTAEKPLVSILSGPTKSPNKAPKHVTFNIPEFTSSAASTESSSPTSSDSNSRPEPNMLTKTSTAVVTPIVSSHVIVSSFLKKPEGDNNSQLTSTVDKVESNKQEFTSLTAAQVVSSSNQSLVTSTMNSQPSFSFTGNNFMMKSSTLGNANVQVLNSATTQSDQSTDKSEKTSPKGGFKFNLSTQKPEVSNQPSIMTGSDGSSQQNSKTMFTASMLSFNQTPSSTNTLFPTQTTVVPIGTTAFTTSANSFSSITNSSFDVTVGGSMASDKSTPNLTNAYSLKFPVGTDNNKTISNATSAPLFSVSSTATAVNSSGFITSSGTTKPSFPFPVNFKSPTPGMFESVGKPALPTVTSTTANLTLSNPITSVSSTGPPSFNKPTISFSAPNTPFASMLTGGAQSNPAVNFSPNNSLFDGNNFQLQNLKKESQQPIFRQDPNSAQMTNSFAFAATTNTLTPTTNAFRIPTTKAFAATITNAFATSTTNVFTTPTTNAFAAPTNAFAPPATNPFATPTTSAFATSTTNPFATSTTNAFATPTTNPFATPTTNTFAAPTTNAFATPTTNAFAAPTTNAFAAPTTNAFAVPTTNAFGAATTNAFAAPTTNAFAVPTTTAFAAPTTNAFAVPTTNAFAAPTTNAFAVPTTNAFAAPTTNAFAAPTTNAFAAPTTNAFAASTTNAFAAPTTNAFAAPTTNIFATPTTNVFAATTTTTNVFAPTTSAFPTTTNTFAPTTNVFAPTSNTFGPTTNAFAPTTTAPSNVFRNTTTFATPTTNPSTNFGPNFRVDQNAGFNTTTANSSAPAFANVFGVTTTAPSFNSSTAFQSNANMFSSSFGNDTASKGNNFQLGQFQGANNAFTTGGFGVVYPSTTQGEVFTFGGNGNKPGVFSFGNSEPPKPTFNFTPDNATNTFGANKSFGSAFAPPQPTTSQFNIQATIPPGSQGMFNIGTGTTPNRSRTQLKAKRRT